MERSSSITPAIFEDDEALYDPKIMNFVQFEAYVLDCKETNFFHIMPDIYSTIRYLVGKGIQEESIYTWMGSLNEGLRGRNSIWRKAFLALDADNQIQNALENIDQEPKKDK